MGQHDSGKWGKVKMEMAMGGWELRREGANENHVQLCKTCVKLSLRQKKDGRKGEKGLWS